MAEYTLYHGDCLEVMDKLIADGVKVDAVVTDPPYGIDYSPSWKKWNGDDSDFSPIIGDDTPFNPLPFLGFSNVVLFGANNFSSLLPEAGWIVWDKRLSKKKDKMFGYPFEMAWFKSINTNKKLIMVRVLHGGVINADSKYGNNEKRYHPTQKPVQVMKEIIELITIPHDTILDPFMGSGTTGVACMQLDRNFIGIEIDEEYYKIAEKRIETAAMQPVLL